MLGTQSIGIQAPIYKGEENIFDFICSAVQNSGVELNDGDILGITESLVARSQNNYCVVDDIAKSVRELFPIGSSIYLLEPIASRNRFSLILKGIARAFKHVCVIWEHDYDEVGNYIRLNPFTRINYYDYYKQVVEEEGSVIQFAKEIPPYCNDYVLDCCCRHPKSTFVTLSDILKTPIIRQDHTTSGYNFEYGILGSNVAGEEKLKLFPREGNQFVLELQQRIKRIFNVQIECLIYGDGCFKDPVGGIWEFADPVTCPGSTIDWNLTPKELKIKLLAESKSEEEIINSIKESEGQQALGTTPRRVNDLLASLMDLTSGSGDKGTPIVLVKNYFTHYGQG
jgi:hypothetical protein